MCNSRDLFPTKLQMFILFRARLPIFCATILKVTQIMSERNRSLINKINTSDDNHSKATTRPVVQTQSKPSLMGSVIHGQSFLVSNQHMFIQIFKSKKIKNARKSKETVLDRNNFFRKWKYKKNYFLLNF